MEEDGSKYTIVTIRPRARTGAEPALPHPAWVAVHGHAWRPKGDNPRLYFKDYGEESSNSVYTVLVILLLLLLLLIILSTKYCLFLSERESERD